MPRWLRALIVSTVATAVAAGMLRYLFGRRRADPAAATERYGESSHGPLPGPTSPQTSRPPSREEVIEGLSDEQKSQMLSELGGHV